ncbi:LAFA_0B05820g1_1 [Lachancea sp. 'fantastica']|nr:LAFA_0B05820g1_1 [Lachancea sp. 'fantastica']
MAPRESTLTDCTVYVQKPCSDEGSNRTRPAKLVSVSSMIGSVQPLGTTSASRWRQEAHDLFGLKRLAKNYFKSGDIHTKEDGSVNGSHQYRVKISGSTGTHPLSGTMIRVGNRLPQKRQNYSTSMESFADQTSSNGASVKKKQYSMTERANLNSREAGAVLAPAYTVARKSVSNDSDFEFGPAMGNVEIAETGRVLQLSNLPRNCGLLSLLSQITGGPLERIDVLNDPQDQSVIKAIRLNFISDEDAQRFMHFGQSENLHINGYSLAPEWVLPSMNYHLNGNFGTRNDEVHGTGASTNTTETTPRRCIIVKKTGHKEHLRSRQLSSKKLCQFDIGELKRDFAEFGKIAEVTPMISRKLCVSISYFDIRSAMNVIASYENPSTYMNRKYYREWSINYGRDITERPCYMKI